MSKAIWLPVNVYSYYSLRIHYYYCHNASSFFLASTNLMVGNKIFE